MASEANAKAEKQDTTVESELDLSKIKTVKAKPLTKKEFQAERIEREKNIAEVIQNAHKKGIVYNKAQKLKKFLSEKQIIEKIGGLDNKGGACSSQALAYIANKFGLDVKDYRGKESLEFFADHDIINMFTKSGGFSSRNYNGYKNAVILLQHVEPGKEYYFTSGEHAAIVRKKRNHFEYLELQDEPENNGFQELDESALKIRFGTKKSKTINGEKDEWDDYLIDVEKLKDSPKFRELLGYFNTQGDV